MPLIEHNEVMKWDSVTRQFVPGDAGGATVKRVTAGVDNNTNTLANITDLSQDVVNGKHYSFEIVLRVSDANGEGITLDLDGGSATVSSIWATYDGRDNAQTILEHPEALATDVTAEQLSGDAIIRIDGALTASADGTFIPRFAQKNHSGAHKITVLKGSWSLVREIP